MTSRKMMLETIDLNQQIITLTAKNAVSAAREWNYLHPNETPISNDDLADMLRIREVMKAIEQ